MRKLARAAVIFGVLSAFVFSPYAKAADGTLGSTSTGVSTVTVTVPDLIKISSVADISFGTYAGSGDLNANDDVCVYTNKTGGAYRVTGTGSGAAGAFTLASGGNTLSYAVFFNDQSGTTGEQSLTAGTPLGSQSGANTSSLTCGGSNDANFHVRIVEANLLAVPSGAYTGTLSLLVEPI
jgi:hypothetical protein